MTGSLRLLLEDFLGLMREEGELDVFLPMLMSAMGHEVIVRAQKGPRQYGVDIASVGTDDDGTRKLFMWLVKRGDIGRTDWNSGPQSVRQSIDDVSDVYLRSHVSPEHKKLPKKLLVVTNGDFSSNLTETIAGFLDQWQRRNKVEAARINGSQIAAWTERHLLDEHVLPPKNKSLLRRMLANVTSPQLCVSVGRKLIDSLLDEAIAPEKSNGAAIKRLLTGLRGVRTTLQVLLVWSRNEDCLSSAYTLAQYALLAFWARLHQRLVSGESPLTQEFMGLIDSLCATASEYHDRMDPYYVVQDGFATACPDALLVSHTVFDQLGKLGQQGCMLALFAAVAGQIDSEAGASLYAERVKAVLRTHSCSGLPAFDYHAVNVHAALLLLAVTNEFEVAKSWLREMCHRLGAATIHRKYLPLTAEFDDAVAVRDGDAAAPDEFSRTSTLLPIMLLWAAVYGMNDVYAMLRTEVVPRLAETTLNCWSAEEGFDAAVGSGRAMHEHGIGESMDYLPEDPRKFLKIMAAGLPDVAGIETAAWHVGIAPYIPLLAGIHWNSQLPREMLAKQAMAYGLAAFGSPSGDSAGGPAQASDAI